MSYASLMVHLELGRSNTNLIGVAGGLAERLKAGVIGIATCRPLDVAYGDICVSGDLIEDDLRQIANEVKAVEIELRDALSSRVAFVASRAATTTNPLVDYLAGEARCADLIVTGHGPAASLLGNPRHIDLGYLVMRAGRPVLIVPEGVGSLALERVVIAWKDTREARRAVADALPLLTLATHVTVVEFTREADLENAKARLDDVTTWLSHHDVQADSEAMAAPGDDITALAEFAGAIHADLMVAGAFGHARLREWALGGMTQDLLLHAVRCTLLSH